jgi:hypothetical protein
MILPNTPLYQAKSDAEFRLRMIQHIKAAYKDLLGDDIKLLDLPNGLDIVQRRVQERLYQISNGEIDLLPATAKQLAA